MSHKYICLLYCHDAHALQTVVLRCHVIIANKSPVNPLLLLHQCKAADTQPPKQDGQSPAEESTDHSADANISDRDPEVGASVKQTREGKPGQDGKLHISCGNTCTSYWLLHQDWLCCCHSWHLALFYMPDHESPFLPFACL